MVRIFIVFALFCLSGCATVMNDAAHPVKVETKTLTGEVVAGAECKLSNDYGAINAKSGESVRVRRSSQDLDIVCKHPSHPDANARAISRVNAGMFGNIIIGGGIGAIIDHTKGTAYTYPTWVQLVFGKALVFDRSTEKDGTPAVAMEPDGTTPAAAASEGAPTSQTKTAAAELAPAQAKDAPLSPQPTIQPAALTPVASPAPQGSESPVARKLRELQQLRNEGLISEDEYNERRKAILSTM